MSKIANPWKNAASPSGVAWREDRDRVDLAAVVTRYLGPVPGRRGDRGRLWWPCPFHPDRNPSFGVKGNRWRCFGCGVSGDAIDFVRRLEHCDFPEAVAILTGRPLTRHAVRGPARIAPLPAPTVAPRPPTEPSSGPSGIDPEAAALVERAAVALWEPAAEAALDRLRARGLSDETIRAARLGWTGPVAIPKSNGSGTYEARGVVIPWFGRDGRLALVKIRQPDRIKPKYAEAYRDPPRVLCYPGPEAVRPGRPVILAEGELDRLCVASLLADLGVSVVTLGSASGRPAPALLTRLLAATPWYAAHDADPAGDRASEAWPDAVRARPPEGHNDWCEAYRADPVALLRHWCLALHRPDAFTTAARLKALWPGMSADPHARAEREAIQSESAHGLTRETTPRVGGVNPARDRNPKPATPWGGTGDRAPTAEEADRERIDHHPLRDRWPPAPDHAAGIRPHPPRGRDGRGRHQDPEPDHRAGRRRGGNQPDRGRPRRLLQPDRPAHPGRRDRPRPATPRGLGPRWGTCRRPALAG